MAFLRSFILAFIYLTGAVTLVWSIFPDISYADPGPGGEDDDPGDDDDDIDEDFDDDEDDIDEDFYDDEPEIDEPEIDEPEIDEPEIDEPEIDEPEVDEPEVDEPEVDEPEVDEPDVDEPEVDEPEVDEPEVDEPEVDEPEVDEPEVDEPEVDEPDVDEPEVDEPEVDEPEVDEPDVDEPEVDEPEVDEPEVDEPEVDEPEVDVPDVDEPEVDEPDVDEPEDGEPEVDDSNGDEPDVDEPEVDDSTDDEPDVDEPDVDEPEVDDSTDDEPDVDEPEVDEPDVDDSTDDDVDDDNSGSGSSGSGSDDDDDNDDDNSGSGNSGSGSDDDDDVDDDNSGSGSSGSGSDDDDDNDDDNSGSGSSGSGSDDDDDNDDGNSGSGNSGSGNSGSGNSGSGSSNSGSGNSGSGNSGSGNSGSGNSGSGSSNSGSGIANKGPGSNELSADSFDAQQDEDGNLAVLGEWLVLVNPRELNDLSQRGYTASETTYLGGLDKILARIEAPNGYNFRRVQRDFSNLSPSTQVDFNHLYTTKSGKSHTTGTGIVPRAVLDVAPKDLGANLKIGMIDTGIMTDHAVFTGARIKTQDFVSYQFQRPKHGTSVASILVGEAGEYKGLVPRAELYAASVFFKSPTGGERATTENLVQALDWMVENDVQIINMSLAGPSNAVLDAAIKRAQSKGAIIIAAVGNEGPSAKPLYPAGYKDVIAVTAVNGQNNIYRLANRGTHVDFAAPGVAIRNASGNGTYQTSSGTSFAAPFAAVILAVAYTSYDKPTQQVIRELQSNALDLGTQGFDPVYGYGLIKPLPNPTKK